MRTNDISSTVCDEYLGLGQHTEDSSQRIQHQHTMALTVVFLVKPAKLLDTIAIVIGKFAVKVTPKAQPITRVHLWAGSTSRTITAPTILVVTLKAMNNRRVFGRYVLPITEIRTKTSWKTNGMMLIKSVFKTEKPRP